MKKPGLFRRTLERVRDPLDLWAVKFLCVGHFDTICLSDGGSEPVRTEFLKTTREALSLIRRVDPRRYRRVRRVVRFISNVPMISRGSYAWKNKICRVDFTKQFRSKNPTWNVRKLACLIIHESTHGVLRERKIPNDKTNWQRVEALCRLEEKRFARRVDPAWAEKFVPPFDPKDWKISRGSRRNRRAAFWKRLREQFLSLRSR